MTYADEAAPPAPPPIALAPPPMPPIPPPIPLETGAAAGALGAAFYVGSGIPALFFIGAAILPPPRM